MSGLFHHTSPAWNVRSAIAAKDSGKNSSRSERCASHLQCYEVRQVRHCKARGLRPFAANNTTAHWNCGWHVACRIGRGPQRTASADSMAGILAVCSLLQFHLAVAWLTNCPIVTGHVLCKSTDVPACMTNTSCNKGRHPIGCSVATKALPRPRTAGHGGSTMHSFTAPLGAKESSLFRNVGCHTSNVHA